MRELQLLDIRRQGQRIAGAKASSFDLGLLKHRAIDVFEGRYERNPATARGGAPRTQLGYTTLIGLCLPPPPAIGTLAIRQNLAAQLQAVAQEVERRTSRPRPKRRMG